MNITELLYPSYALQRKAQYVNIYRIMGTDELQVYMQAALSEAQKAFDMGEVPVGAVIVKDGRIVGRGCNSNETSKDPTCHAEITAIREACRVLGGWRLPGCSMFVTTEPCSMCAGAIVLARIERLYIGTADPKTGACGSLFNIVNDQRLNHQVAVEYGLLQKECSEMLKRFFRELRSRKNNKVSNS